jgi:hypothetical protein
MTAARRQRKAWLAARTFWWAASCVAAACLALERPALAPGARAAASDPVVVDRHTGLALSGFDPVAFFADARPVPGSAAVELRLAGAVWRFENVGNRAAFAARPDVYMPRFGGHDPVAAARGVAVPGNPLVWFISGERLYLFYSRKALDAFAGDPDRFIAAAERKWPQILRTFTP